MGRERIKFIIGSIVIAAFFAGGISTAQAADDIVAEGACCTFIGGPFSQAAGEVPTFVNPADADAFHNVTSAETGPDGGPLFESETIPFGQSAPVKGAQYLTDGSYPFVCTIHAPSMKGELVVSGGTALPRPKVAISIPSQKLKKVRKSGKVKVKVKAVTAAPGIVLKLSKGKKQLGFKSGLSVAAGKTKTVAVKLTGKGKKALKNGKKVKISANGAVAFGKAAKASRTLR
ncbi:MAG: hypothetical protein WBW62_05355 [Solirubrobacterales bacterium]